ncbi:uncharacterized protein LOC119776192 isoform X2 [Cyprinodon tularosa]|uniref:uncharacterized protein LOC119776192 isoform X2 n=1 Tax=Cyprinodon tularosa TaxID=77115 RepID=UPI0018E2014D|nr:uncharacterized protein LOC119776192 isoform X2 [Cyprinodon tularosa]
MPSCSVESPRGSKANQRHCPSIMSWAVPWAFSQYMIYIKLPRSILFLLFPAGAPSRTEVDEDKIAMVCKYLIYQLQGAREDILRYCDVNVRCKTIGNYTNGTLKGDPFLKDTGCFECIEQKLYVVVTNNITQSGGYYELQCNGVVERVTEESLRKISGLTTTPGLLSCAEGLTTTPGLLSCAEGLTTTAGSTLAVPPTTGVGSILYAGEEPF